MNIKEMMYIIDRNYKIVYMNEGFKENYPDISCGETCYKALGDKDSVCSHCPRKMDAKTNSFYNAATGEWVKAQMAQMVWNGDSQCYAILTRVWRGTEKDREEYEEKEEHSIVEEMLMANNQMAGEMRLIQEELQRKNELLSHQKYDLIVALSREYGNIYSVNLKEDKFEIYRLEKHITDRVKEAMENSANRFSYCCNTYIQDCVLEADRKLVSDALSVDNIRKQLEDKSSFNCFYRVNLDDVEVYHQVKCIRLNPNDTSNVIVGFKNVDEEVRRDMEQKQVLADALMQAEAANSAKSDFLSNMSHDIRTPMNAILGMTAIAAMHIDDRERVMDSLNKITLSGKHLLGIINSVLDMSKIESGKINLNEEEFNLSDSIESLLTIFYSQMVEKNQELKVNVTSIQHENVIGDNQRLQQIFINIMGNAVKFTPEGGTITLSIREKSSDVSGRACYEFVFEDNGIGMEKSFVDRIFEPFARAADSRTTHIEGTGLGMSIAVNVARLMGGDIQVESELGKGSRFIVTVYLRINDVREDDLKMLASLPVLVVDDEEFACISACDILQSLEMEPEYVLSGDAAVDRVCEAHEEDKDFSLIILDWKMPGKDGIETAREIRRIMGDDIPIIILSAYDWSDIEQEATMAGINAFIEKPLFKSRLTHVLKEVMGFYNTPVEQPELDSFQQNDYSGKRVLLVEDNELNIEVAEELLRVVGLDVDVALNGRDAVDKILDMPEKYYDIIFMDIQMPVMNGYEATEAIRHSNRHDLASIPIVAMTADAFDNDVKKTVEAGMNGHIAKPVDIKKLEQVIHKFIH